MTIAEFIAARIDEDEEVVDADDLRGGAEIALKRVLLEEVSRYGGIMLDLDCPGTTVAKALAAVYAGHLDYREEWAP